MRKLLLLALLAGGCATFERPLDNQCFRFVARHGRDNPMSRGCAEVLDAIDRRDMAQSAAIARGVLGVVAGVADDMKPKAEIVCKPLVGGAPEYGMKCVER